MNIERLKLMSDMLGEVVACTWRPTSTTVPTIRSVPVEDNIKFELHSWFGLTPDYCGYSACAVGHACFDERFNKLGLVFGDFGPEYDGLYSPWGAISMFFDLDKDVAEYLFSDFWYFDLLEASKIEWKRDGSRPPVTADMVKARIDDLIGV